MMLRMFKRIAHIVNAIAALNWFIAAFFGLQYNVVSWVRTVTGVAYIDQVLYAVIGLSGAYALTMTFLSCCKMCECSTK